MPNTSGLPVVLYDDTGADIDESRLMSPVTGVKKIIYGNDPVDILKAAETVCA